MLVYRLVRHDFLTLRSITYQKQLHLIHLAALRWIYVKRDWLLPVTYVFLRLNKASPFSLGCGISSGRSRSPVLAPKVINHAGDLSEDFVTSALRHAVNEPFIQVSGHYLRFLSKGALFRPVFNTVA